MKHTPGPWKWDCITNHEHAEVTCHACGQTCCWTCSNGPHPDNGDWSGQTCPSCGENLNCENVVCPDCGREQWGEPWIDLCPWCETPVEPE